MPQDPTTRLQTIVTKRGPPKKQKKKQIDSKVNKKEQSQTREGQD